MTARLIGGVFLVLCGTLIGLEYRRRLKCRLEAFQMVRNYLREVSSYISHYGMSLDDITKAIARERSSDSFSLKIRDYSSRDSFSKAFFLTLKDLCSRFCLTEEDIERISSIVGNISGLDVDGTLSGFEFAGERLDELIASAKEKYETDGKLYVTVGLCLSVVAALVVI